MVLKFRSPNEGHGEMQMLLFTPEGKLCQYLLVLDLSDEVANDIIELKEEIRQEIGEFSSYHSHPHITLWLLTVHDELLPKIVAGIEEACRRASPFVLNVDGFGAFNGNGVIFLKPVEKEDILNLQQKILGQIQQKFTLPTGKRRIISDPPHITIARRLDPKTFQRLWQKFETREYRKSFTARSVTLFLQHPVQKSVLIRKFEFGM